MHTLCLLTTSFLRVQLSKPKLPFLMQESWWTNKNCNKVWPFNMGFPLNRMQKKGNGVKTKEKDIINSSNLMGINGIG